MFDKKCRRHHKTRNKHQEKNNSCAYILRTGSDGTLCPIFTTPNIHRIHASNLTVTEAGLSAGAPRYDAL